MPSRRDALDRLIDDLITADDLGIDITKGTNDADEILGELVETYIEKLNEGKDISAEGLIRSTIPSELWPEARRMLNMVDAIRQVSKKRQKPPKKH